MEEGEKTTTTTTTTTMTTVNASAGGLSERALEQLHSFAKLVEHRMQLAARTFSEEILPSLLCNASAAIAGNVSSTLWTGRLSVESLLQLGVVTAMRSEEARLALDSISGINGTEYVEYLLTLDNNANRERLFGVGAELMRATVRSETPQNCSSSNHAARCSLD